MEQDFDRVAHFVKTIPGELRANTQRITHEFLAPLPEGSSAQSSDGEQASTSPNAFQFLTHTMSEIYGPLAAQSYAIAATIGTANPASLTPQQGTEAALRSLEVKGSHPPVENVVKARVAKLLSECRDEKERQTLIAVLWELQQNETIRRRMQSDIQEFKSANQASVNPVLLKPTEQDLYDRAVLQHSLKLGLRSDVVVALPSETISFGAAGESMIGQFIRAQGEIVATTKCGAAKREAHHHILTEAYTELQVLSRLCDECGNNLPPDSDAFSLTLESGDFSKLFTVLVSSRATMADVVSGASTTDSLASLRALVFYLKYKVAHESCEGCTAATIPTRGPSSSSVPTVHGRRWADVLLLPRSIDDEREPMLPNPVSFLETLINPKPTGCVSTDGVNEDDDEEAWVATYDPKTNSFAPESCNQASSCYFMCQAFRLARWIATHHKEAKSFRLSTSCCCRAEGCGKLPLVSHFSHQGSSQAHRRSIAPKSFSTVATQTTNTTLWVSTYSDQFTRRTARSPKHYRCNYRSTSDCSSIDV